MSIKKTSPVAPLTRTTDLSLSVIKAIRLLRLVSEARDGIALTEIVAESGQSMTVCYRMLTTLEHERFVEKDRLSGRYRLGPGLIDIAGKALHSDPMRARAVEVLSEIVSVTQDCGLLMVNDRDEALCLSRIEGDSPINIAGANIGSRMPLHCGGTPFAILAFSNDSYIDAYLSTRLEKKTPKTITDPGLIRARITEARSRGYTVGDEDLFPYVVAVGVPIFEPDGRLLGAMSIGGVKQRFDDARIHEVGALLRATTQRLLPRSQIAY